MDVFTEEVMAIWDKKAFFSSEANFLTTNGEKIKAIISFIIPENKNDFKSIPVSIQDITRLDYKQDRLRALLDSISDIIFIFDAEEKYIEILTSQQHLLYDQLKILKGNYINKILPKESADIFIKTINAALDLDKTQSIEYQLDVPQGRRWFEGRVSPMQTTFNDKQAVLWLAVDITENKHLETQLRQAQKMEAIGLLAGGIAHDFNNLLSPILGYTELLLDDKSEDDQDYSSLEQIFIAGNRAKALVKQLLAYGRRSMSHREVVHLDIVLKDAMKLIKNTIPSNIRVKIDIAPKLPPIIGMPNEIHQIIINLCVNAYHAMPDGGRLLISLEKRDPKNPMTPKPENQINGFLCLTVKDTGVGIEEGILNRIFDPFFTTKNIGQGSGLGLSVVQGIVEQHAGQIEVNSKKTMGAAFHIYFPIVESATESVVPSKRLLLKGDEQIILDLTKNMLESLDYRVSHFLDGKQALQHFSECPDDFDLVIIDYGMPEMNGKQFVEKLTSIRPDIPIILCTGYGDLIAKENIKQWGIDELLIKPFSFKEISEMVRVALNK